MPGPGWIRLFFCTCAAVLLSSPSVSSASDRDDCVREMAAGRRTSGIALCRSAVGTERSAENLAALALALIDTSGTPPPTSGEREQAVLLAQEAVADNPDSAVALEALCAVGSAVRRTWLLSDCAPRLLAIAPERAGSHWYAAVLAANEGKLEVARAELEEAHRRGLPDARYADFVAELRTANAIAWPELLRIVGTWTAVAWFVTLALLLTAGEVMTLFAVRAAARRGAGPALRTGYAILLRACAAFYYFSLPLLVVVVIGLGGGALYAIVHARFVPVYLVFSVLFFTVMTTGAVIGSVFTSGRVESLGVPLDLEANPKLKTALAEVARAVKTPVVDAVFLVPGAVLAVTEDGTMADHLKGSPRRCLVVGAALLEDLDEHAFRAILAHEYGHFSNRDTADGGFALRIRRSLLAMAEDLEQMGGPFNPAWLFLHAFEEVFLQISRGATRLQEVMADRHAVEAQGRGPFERGLRHVVRQQLLFDLRLRSALGELLQTRSRVTNIYALPFQAPEPDLLAKALDEAWNHPASRFDSHPPPADRMRLVAGSPEGPAETGPPAWDLFADRPAIEHRMSEVLHFSLKASA